MRITLSLPDAIAREFQKAFPPRHRSRVVAGLLAKELKKRQTALAKACEEANRDRALGREIEEWQSFEDAPTE